MKLELDDNSYWAVFFGIVSVTIVSLALIGTLYYARITEAAFAAGYQEGAIQGHGTPVWVKPAK